MTVSAIKGPKQINSLNDLFRLVSKSRPTTGTMDLYRGHSEHGHDLRPSLLRRKEYRRVEKQILREMIAIQPNEFRDDRSSFEQLVRMQHYGLPTRLLDLTLNPLVALYFAVASNPADDGELIRLRVQKTRMKYFDSDTVSCVANLSNLTGGERDQIRRMTTSAELNESDVGRRLLHFIKAEKPYFTADIELPDLKKIYAVRPKQTNRRILAQQGAFLLFGLQTRIRSVETYGFEVVRTIISAEHKQKIAEELDGININGSALFPEIESAAKYIMSKIEAAEDRDEIDD